MKLQDLECEFCDGEGWFSRDNADGVAVEGDCSFCNGTGIDNHQLELLFNERHKELLNVSPSRVIEIAKQDPLI